MKKILPISDEDVCNPQRKHAAKSQSTNELQLDIFTS